MKEEKAVEEKRVPNKKAKSKKRIKHELNKLFKAHGRTSKQVKKRRAKDATSNRGFNI